MQRPTIGPRCGEQVADLRNNILSQLHLENGKGICNAHGQASLRVRKKLCSCKLSAGGPLGYQAKAATCREIITYATRRSGHAQHLWPCQTQVFKQLSMSWQFIWGPQNLSRKAYP